MQNVIKEKEQAFFWDLGPEANEAANVLLQGGIDDRSFRAATEKHGPFFLPTSLGRRLVASVGQRLGAGTLREVEVTRDEQGRITWFSLPADQTGSTGVTETVFTNEDNG